MALNKRYIPSKYFQESILDKDTGCNLAGGKVKFFKDIARTEPKDVFIISGTPPGYVYTSIGSEVTLSSIGTFQYEGNDIIPYFYPYDDELNLELYYAEIYSSGDVPQFTREGFPNIIEDLGEDEKLINYIPNGQFLLHTDIVADYVVSREAGQITEDTTIVAHGGWSFERTTGSTAIDFVEFERIGSYVTTPNNSPRYNIRTKCQTPDVTDTFKALRIKFRDSNKFASTENGVTFSFVGKSNSGFDSSVDIKFIRNYGTGGSSTEDPIIKPVTLTTSYQTFDISYTPTVPTGTPGDDDDDFIQFSIEFPTTVTFDNSFDNFILTDGEIEITTFPDTTDAKFIKDSDAGWLPVPRHKSEDLYLPVLQGPNGFVFSTKHVGSYELKSTETLEIGELWCDGSGYRVNSYSSDGIPYRRLYEKWSAGSPIGLSIYGTSRTDYRHMTTGTANIFAHKSNSSGAVTATADGATPTGFIFTAVQPNPYIIHITYNAGSTLSGGEYYTYHTIAPKKFIVWYEVDGVGTQPVESSDRYIKIAILSTDTDVEVGTKTAIGINSHSIKTPDWRGYFIRIQDDGAAHDPNAATRTNRGDETTGDNIGTVQQDEFKAHAHPYNQANTFLNQSGSETPCLTNIDLLPTESTGGAETRPKNRYLKIAVNY